jgi:hypothetical protein
MVLNRLPPAVVNISSRQPSTHMVTMLVTGHRSHAGSAYSGN